MILQCCPPVLYCCTLRSGRQLRQIFIKPIHLQLLQLLLPLERARSAFHALHGTSLSDFGLRHVDLSICTLISKTL